MATIEQEFESRSMISEEKYFEIVSDFYHINPQLKTISQVNQYFDTDDRSLTKNNMVLRIRSIKGKGAVLTLKVGRADGSCTEYSQKITYFQHKALVEKSHFPKGQVKLSLMGEGCSLLDIHYICDIKTTRVQISHPTYNYCVDKNRYCDTVDYNIEVEADNMKNSAQILAELSNKYNFEISKEYIVKSKRALFYKK